MIIQCENVGKLGLSYTAYRKRNLVQSYSKTVDKKVNMHIPHGTTSSIYLWAIKAYNHVRLVHKFSHKICFNGPKL